MRDPLFLSGKVSQEPWWSSYLWGESSEKIDWRTEISYYLSQLPEDTKVFITVEVADKDDN